MCRGDRRNTARTLTALPRYRGRIAPTPTGDLHLGHAQTFLTAWQRAADAQGELILRIEDLDLQRCKPEYAAQIVDDLRWIGISWTAGPLYQSARRDVYLAAWLRLRDCGAIYPSTVGRGELRNVAFAPHDEDEGAEPLFPPSLRAPLGSERAFDVPDGATWRYRVPDGETITVRDPCAGDRTYVAGVDFGDFVVWRKDSVPAYELAVVADDVAMGITEVVRGSDLLKSTARQLLIYRSLGAPPPTWCHQPLVRDANGVRLAKRDRALALRTLRQRFETWDACRAALTRGTTP